MRSRLSALIAMGFPRGEWEPAGIGRFRAKTHGPIVRIHSSAVLYIADSPEERFKIAACGGFAPSQGSIPDTFGTAAQATTIGGCVYHRVIDLFKKPLAHPCLSNNLESGGQTY